MDRRGSEAASPLATFAAFDGYLAALSAEVGSTACAVPVNLPPITHMSRFRSVQILRLRNVCRFVAVAIAAFTIVVPPAVAQQSEESVTAAPIAGPTRLTIRYSESPPVASPAQLLVLEQATSRSKPALPVLAVGPGAVARANAPATPPSLIAGSIAATGVSAAPGTFALFGNSSLAGGPSRSQTNEPSVANNGFNIFASYNWYAGLSTNNGQTWAYVDPYTAFPAANGGFCCDQDVFYDASRDLTFWLLQYVKNAQGNVLRLAVAQGRTGLASGNWYYYDFPPVGNCAGAVAGDWFDYPHLTRSSNFLYLGSNVFTAADAFRCTTLMRLPLDQLASASSLSFQYFSSQSVGSFKAAEGATDTMYFASQSSTTQTRVYTWPESTTTLTSNDVARAASINGPFSCVVTASGVNPCGREDTRIQAAWLRRGTELGFMWGSAQGADGLGTFAYPYVRVLTMNASSKAVLSDAAIWNASFAWLVPSAAVNSRDHVGGTIAYAGGAYHPSCGAWLYDDYSSAMLPLESVSVQTGTSSPSGDRWGDYLRTRRSGLNSQQWIGTCYAIEGGTVTPRVAQFGRARDEACTQDIDGNGSIDALTDGLLLTRAMFGLTGTAVTSGALGAGAKRTTWAAIRDYLNGACSANFAP